MLCEQYIEASISTKNVLVALECGEELGLEFIKVCRNVVPGAFLLEGSEVMNFHLIYCGSEYRADYGSLLSANVFQGKCKLFLPAFTCPKLTVETLEQGKKYV